MHRARRGSALQVRTTCWWRGRETALKCVKSDSRRGPQEGQFWFRKLYVESLVSRISVGVCLLYCTVYALWFMHYGLSSLRYRAGYPCKLYGTFGR